MEEDQYPTDLRPHSGYMSQLVAVEEQIVLQVVGLAGLVAVEAGS
jgi:hypothetical protein